MFTQGCTTGVAVPNPCQWVGKGSVVKKACSGHGNSTEGRCWTPALEQQHQRWRRRNRCEQAKVTRSRDQTPVWVKSFPRYSQLTYNPCFGNSNFLQSYWGIREQFEHRISYAHVCPSRNTRWMQKTASRLGTHKTHADTHTPNFYQLPQFTTSVMSHVPPHPVLRLSVWFLIIFLPPLHDNSQTAALPTSTSTSKLQVLLKCHIFVLSMYFSTISQV